jgi:hypothetical protein
MTEIVLAKVGVQHNQKKSRVFAVVEGLYYLDGMHYFHRRLRLDDWHCCTMENLVTLWSTVVYRKYAPTTSTVAAATPTAPVILDVPIEPDALVEAEAAVELLESPVDDDTVVVELNEESVVDVIEPAASIATDPVELEEPTAVSIDVLPVAPTAGVVAPVPEAAVVVPAAGAAVALVDEATPVAPVAGVTAGVVAPVLPVEPVVVAAAWPETPAMARAAMTRTWKNFMVAGECGGWWLKWRLVCT